MKISKKGFEKSKKKIGKDSHSQRVRDILKIKFLLIGTVVGLSIGGLTAVIVTGINKSQAVHDANNYHPATFAIAEKFMCGCPNCNKELVDCACNHSAGGSYELYYISQRLKEGLSEDQVTRAVYERFGRIKNNYLNKGR